MLQCDTTAENGGRLKAGQKNAEQGPASSVMTCGSRLCSHLRIQPNHGLRKYFEQALDKADIDHEPKMILEGHFAGARAKSYSSREWDELRPVYRKAYAFIDPEQSNVEMAVKVQSQEDEVKDLRKELASLSAQLAAIRREMQKKK